MHRDPADLGRRVMQRYPAQLGNTRIRRVMIEKAGAPLPHACVRVVGETPEHGSEACLPCAR